MAVLVTFHWACLGYVFFRAPSVAAGWHTLARLISPAGMTDRTPGWLGQLSVYLVAVGFFHWMQYKHKNVFWIFDRPLWVRALCYGTLAFCTMRFYAPAEKFIYFQF